MQIRVLFIIPVLARSQSDERLLKRCLESIKKHDPGMLPHTIIVEEFASLGVPWCQNYGCAYIHKHTPPSYSDSINLGISHAAENSYTHVVTINQDIEFTYPVLVPFIRAFNYADIVGGLLLYPNGAVQSAGWYYRSDVVPIEYEKSMQFTTCRDSTRERFVGGITGALQGFSLECGLYSDKFSLSYEDVEFCIRNLQEGKRILYTPTIKAVHVESATRGRFVGPTELKSYHTFRSIVQGIHGSSLNSIFEAYNKDI